MNRRALPPLPAACATISLGPTLPSSSSSLPGAQRGRAVPCPQSGRRSCLALLPVGVAWPGPLLGPPVVSYTTFSPSPLAFAGGGRFLWPCPRVSPPGRCPAPCPVERGLSSGGPSTKLRAPTVARPTCLPSHHSRPPGRRQCAEPSSSHRGQRTSPKPAGQPADLPPGQTPHASPPTPRGLRPGVLPGAAPWASPW